ncbi:MAG: hypothetical protein WCH84_08280, partial [Verrucomicrobiota bacterium]
MPANENTRDAADMIPKEIGAIQGLFETNISDWRLELMTTNWVGYWMLQLSNKKQKPLAFLIDLDNLAAVCQGLRKCIDATKSSDFNLPRTSTIIITCASQLHTPD